MIAQYISIRPPYVTISPLYAIDASRRGRSIIAVNSKGIENIRQAANRISMMIMRDNERLPDIFVTDKEIICPKVLE